MSRNDLLRLIGALALSAAAGWVGAVLVAFERDSRPHREPHPFDRFLDGTIARR